MYNKLALFNNTFSLYLEYLFLNYFIKYTIYVYIYKHEISRDFKQSGSLKTLYCTLVRPILEYGSVFWGTHTAVESTMIERVQRTFLRFSSYVPHDYTPIIHVLNLSSLLNRRHMANIRFLSGLLSSLVGFPSLLAHFNLSRCFNFNLSHC